MAGAYSQDLRARVLAAAHDGRHSYGALAALFRVGESTIRGWLRRERDTGSSAPKPHAGGAPPAVAGPAAEALKALVDARPAATLAELADGLHAATGRRPSVSTVCRACRRLALRRKKNQPRRQRAGARGRGRGA
jgi:putative transposase